MAGPPPLAAGCRVRLGGLKARGDLNGAEGRAVQRKPTGRWQVRLASGESILAQEANIATLHELLALMGCHIAAAERIAPLRHCLASVAAQTKRPPLLISWSAAPELADEVRRTLAEAAGPCDDFVEQPGRLPQGAHLRALLPVARRRGGAACWVMFTDDDDIWHPQRCEFYSDRLALAPELDREGTPMSCLYCPTYAEGHERPQDAAAVYRLIAGGGARLHVPGGAALTKQPSGEDEEYWQRCARLQTLEEFFTVAPEQVVKDHRCDVALNAFMGSWGKPKASMICDVPEHRANWMYYYHFDKRPGAGKMSRAITVTEADRERAAKGSRHTEADAQQIAKQRSNMELCMLRNFGRFRDGAGRPPDVLELMAPLMADYPAQLARWLREWAPPAAEVATALGFADAARQLAGPEAP
eukprot:TRINITY_DN11471_c0_g1_i2.p1 TRINITY_DN11471_c0_g1~~TRINITY_DN11471_c0_g1_i2.p1  ORF type:complete len:437 (+),score=110.08 TRINITY_DN11471_c0_g1_i2:69-1313(+)